MTSWDELERELDLWQSEKKIATFWWRDDDLIEPSPALDRLLSLRQALEIPLALAVIPATAKEELAEYLIDCSVLQHGYSHQNLAEAEEKKSEFPPSRLWEEVSTELKEGRDALSGIFGDQFLPVFVPPWNRIEDEFLEKLPSLGFKAISRYKPRALAMPVVGLAEINTHIDPINWRGDRKVVAQKDLLTMVVSHLQARRLGHSDFREPTGLLTHHLVHDEDIWAVLFQLMSFLNQHRAVRWITIQAAVALIDELNLDHFQIETE